MEVILCQIRDEQRSLLGPDHPDWQDKVLPGLTALERAGYLTVANQVKKFGIGVDGNAGVYGPKQLAAALGWKRAPRQVVISKLSCCYDVGVVWCMLRLAALSYAGFRHPFGQTTSQLL